MKVKNTLLLLIFAGALFAFIKFYESKQLSTSEAQERAGNVIAFDRDKVNAISIKNSETKIELQKDAKGAWRLMEPVKDPADTMVINQLFTSAESLRHDAAIGDDKKGVAKDQLKEFGLINSDTKVKFTGAERPVELLFGKDSAVEGKVYVKREDSDIAYVIAKELKEQISRKVDEFRDRKLTDLNIGQIDRLVIKTAAGEIEAEKKNGHWSLTKPLKARGDNAKINDLISQTATARIENFVADASNAGSYGLQEPRATISLYSEGSELPTVLQLGANPKDEQDKGKTYAKLSTRDSVVMLPKTIESLLETKPNSLRDKSLLRIEADIVDRMTIESSETRRIVLARSGESWVRKVGDKDVEINVSAARRVLDEVIAQQVVQFVADLATDLPKYGLDQPQVTLTLSSYASENTAETKAGEKPVAKVLFGKTENGVVYAKLDDEPFIASVPQTFLETLMTDPLQWQPVEIYKGKTDDITAVEVTREGQTPLSFEREKDTTWKLAKGDGSVNQINLQSLINTLASLRAVRWVGETKPEHGIDKPAFSVSFRTAGNTGGRIVFGATTPDDLTLASAEGLKGTFAVSRPDISAFQLPLIDKPIPAVSPAPATLPIAVPVPTPTVPANPSTPAQ